MKQKKKTKPKTQQQQKKYIEPWGSETAKVLRASVYEKESYCSTRNVHVKRMTLFLKVFHCHIAFGKDVMIS